MHPRLILASLLLGLGLTMACGGGSASSGPTGNLTLRFGSDSVPAFSQVVVGLERVEASQDGATWIPLGNVKATFDLMALQNGHALTVIPATGVRAGLYTHFRLTWATVNYRSIIDQPAYSVSGDGQGRLLTMPMTSVIGGSVPVSAGGNTVAQIMLDGKQAVQARSATAATFLAAGRAYDLAASAGITGRLADGAAPLAGVEVFAETVDGLGIASLQRRAVTDASGNYVLEGLPTGGLYFVAAQPASAYAAAASAPVNATSATTYTANLAFSNPQTPGTLTLSITPASSTTQGTWGELRQALATGAAGSQMLIVRSQAMVTGASADQATFLGLAPGIYGVTAQRSTSGAAPAMKTGAQVLVSAGATATTALSFP